jgi:ABC-type transport system involved in cytochrome bd biosynthesis fused ATPase/permease subunit
VRLGRAFLRRQPRLVLLDEPFRGLERERRAELLRRTRSLFRDATLLFASHDIEHTRELDEVLVIETGQIVERGDPRALLEDHASRYSELERSSRLLSRELWDAPFWRRFRVEGGSVDATCSGPEPGRATRS